MEIAWEYIDYQLKELKIDIKAECKKHNISYGNFCRILREHTDMKVSNLIILADMLQVEDMNELFRKVR